MQHQDNTETLVEEKTKTPQLYNVFLLNDDHTSMDFVISVLINIFYKEPKEAEIIMLQIHELGKGLAGTYPKDIAEAKVLKVKNGARSHGFPLQAISEEA